MNKSSVSSEFVEEGIYQILDRILKFTQDAFPLNQVLVVKIISRDIGSFPIRRDHLEMMLLQLILSARKSMEGRAGILTIEAQAKENRFHHESRSFILRVSDTGKPLIQEENTSQDPLDQHIHYYMVKKIVEFYRGHLRIESSPKGNSIHIQFSV